MKFISKQSILKVPVQNRMTVRDPITNDITEVQPSLVARFQRFMFETEDKVMIAGLMKKLEEARQQGRTASFRIFAEDTALGSENKPVRIAEVPVAAETVRQETAAPVADESAHEAISALIETVTQLAESVRAINQKLDAKEAGEETNPPKAKAGQKGKKQSGAKTEPKASGPEAEPAS